MARWTVTCHGSPPLMISMSGCGARAAGVWRCGEVSVGRARLDVAWLSASNVKTRRAMSPRTVAFVMAAVWNDYSDDNLNFVRPQATCTAPRKVATPSIVTDDCLSTLYPSEPLKNVTCARGARRSVN